MHPRRDGDAMGEGLSHNGVAADGGLLCEKEEVMRLAARALGIPVGKLGIGSLKRR